MTTHDNQLSTLLAQKNTLLADGATGTNLFNMGLAAGDAPEFWNTAHPDRIKALYSGAVNAGSDLILTNSFGANAARLKLHDAANQAYALSKASAQLARHVADTADHPVVVAGSIGPTGELMGAVGTLTHDDAVKMFLETAQGLLDGGADVLWAETISAPEEMAAIAETCARLDAPWACTMSFDTAGRTMMGITASDFAKMVCEFTHRPLAFGANCGVGASDLLRTVLSFGQFEHNLPVIAKGNAGIPKYVDGHIHYDGTPELMADYALLAKRLGAAIIGGCCGTTPQHLQFMRKALDGAVADLPPPNLPEIEAALGAFSSLDDGTGDAPKPERQRRGARRRGTV